MREKNHYFANRLDDYKYALEKLTNMYDELYRIREKMYRYSVYDLLCEITKLVEQAIGVILFEMHDNGYIKVDDENE
jgi:hypothetical protein